MDESSMRYGERARGDHRRVIMTTCQTHGAAGFTNLLVTKEDGVIVLNPHAAHCCVRRLSEQAAPVLHGTIGKCLGGHDCATAPNSDPAAG